MKDAFEKLLAAAKTQLCHTCTDLGGGVQAGILRTTTETAGAILMNQETERRLAEYAAENCYTGEHLHALRMGAEIAGEEAVILRACLEHVVNVYLVDDYYGAEDRETLIKRYIDRLMAEQRDKMSEGKNHE